MEPNEYNKGYCAGFIDGYRQGAEDSRNGTVRTYADDEVLNLPIQAKNLSTRSFNCMRCAGCVYIRDVVELSEERISSMRNLGPKSANEIALALRKYGICYTLWNRYLL